MTILRVKLSSFAGKDCIDAFLHKKKVRITYKEMNETMKLIKAFIMPPVLLLIAIAASLPEEAAGEYPRS